MLLFLIENKNQFKKANHIIKSISFSNKHFLFTFDRNPPFFLDINDLKGPFIPWRKYGFYKFQNNRFWLQNFDILNGSLGLFATGNKDFDIIYNKYFCMDLHWKIGNNYIQPLLHFKKFLEKEQVSKVFLKLKNDFISDSIKGICESLRIEATHIFDHKY